jgi:hypothetical protein
MGKSKGRPPKAPHKKGYLDFAVEFGVYKKHKENRGALRKAINEVKRQSRLEKRKAEREAKAAAKRLKKAQAELKKLERERLKQEKELQREKEKRLKWQIKEAQRELLMTPTQANISRLKEASRDTPQNVISEYAKYKARMEMTKAMLQPDTRMPESGAFKVPYKKGRIDWDKFNERAWATQEQNKEQEDIINRIGFTPKKMKEYVRDKELDIAESAVEAREVAKADEMLKQQQTQNEAEADYESSFETQQQVKDLNYMLSYASDKFGFRDDYQKYLGPLLDELTDYEFQKQFIKDWRQTVGDYKYFTIDPAYAQDNKNNLFKYIKFKDLPDNANVDRFIESIAELDWSSPENYVMHKADINRQIYHSNLKKLKIDVNSVYATVLETVMQTSEAWRIAREASGEYDSQQAKKHHVKGMVQEHWYELYDAGTKAYDARNDDPSIWDDFRQMVDNEEKLDTIIADIDSKVKALLKE